MPNRLFSQNWKPSLTPEVNLVEEPDLQVVGMSCFPTCQHWQFETIKERMEEGGKIIFSSRMIDFFAFSQGWGVHLKESTIGYGQLQFSRVREKKKTIRGRDGYNSRKDVSGGRDQILSFRIARYNRRWSGGSRAWKCSLNDDVGGIVASGILERPQVIIHRCLWICLFWICGSFDIRRESGENFGYV